MFDNAQHRGLAARLQPVIVRSGFDVAESVTISMGIANACYPKSHDARMEMDPVATCLTARQARRETENFIDRGVISLETLAFRLWRMTLDQYVNLPAKLLSKSSCDKRSLCADFWARKPA